MKDIMKEWRNEGMKEWEQMIEWMRTDDIMLKKKEDITEENI